jgi:hypothetical protein
MLTRKEFRLPEEPQLTGDPREDMKRIRDHVTACNKAQIEFWRSLNTPEMLSIDMANMRAAYGLVFPAVQNAITDVNTLDDYEEGTWTPAVTFATPGDLAITLSPAVGDYTKIGRLVIASFRLNTTGFTFTTAAGSLNITGLPFTASSDANYVWPGPCTWGGITRAGANITCEILPGTAIGLLTASGSGVAPAVIAATDTPSGGTLRLRGTFIYRV